MERVQNGGSHSLERRLTAPGKRTHARRTQPIIHAAAQSISNPIAHRQGQAGDGSCNDGRERRRPRRFAPSSIARSGRAEGTVVAMCAFNIVLWSMVQMQPDPGPNSTHPRLPIAISGCGIGVAARGNIAALNRKCEVSVKQTVARTTPSPHAPRHSALLEARGEAVREGTT